MISKIEFTARLLNTQRSENPPLIFGEVEDAVTPGLYLHASMNGETDFMFRYFTDGCEYGEFIGSIREVSLDAARKYVRRESRFVQPV
jgi:hypothetical protein